MNYRHTLLNLITAISIVGASANGAASDLTGAMTAANTWIQKNFVAQTNSPPFSFWYNYQSSADLLKACKIERSEKKLDDNRTQETIVYTDPKTLLEVRCVAVEYADFPTVEWTVYFKNTSESLSPFIDDIRAVDTRFECSPNKDFLLHHNYGSMANRADYAPRETPLLSDDWLRIGSAGDNGSGRPSDAEWPYFNLAWDDGTKGVIVVVGWPGQWSSSWRRDEDRNTLRVDAGQELTHLRLKPGEEIRTPLIVLQFWQGGDWIDAQNVWRRWMIKHNLPRPDNKLPEPQLACMVAGFGFCMYGSAEQDSIRAIDHHIKMGLKPDSYWMDTGWFNETPINEEDNWAPVKDRFPNGMRPISDYAHKNGMRSILWFEPERVTQSHTWLLKNRPDWVLHYSKATHVNLFDLGNPEARRWMTDVIDNRLKTEDIDVFRSDFNMGPLDHWRQNDATDRQGIIENKWCSGYLAFWDELRRRNPHLLIDSCASGGKRNDLETLRRSVIFWRSDRDRGHDGGRSMQCQTYGISLWVPYYGAGAPDSGNITPYWFRSCFFPSMTLGYDPKKTFDYDLIRRMVDEWRQINHLLLLGDYYPLTPYDASDSVWMAWQFDSPEKGEGVIQAFRRTNCPKPDIRLILRGLEPNASYELTDFDAPGKEMVMSGKQLMDSGLEVRSESAPGSILIKYQSRK
jgi:alpha-galactosidase